MKIHSKGRFLVVGSINMDTLLHTRRAPKNDGAVLVTHTTQMPGGHAANCASSLAALGAVVALAGAVGNDAHGRALIEDLEQRNIDSRYVQVLADHPTGEVLIPTYGEEHFMLVQRNANDHADANLAEAIERFSPDALVVFDPSPAVFRQLEALRRTGKRSIPTYWIPGGINVDDPELGFMFGLADVIIVNSTERAALELSAPKHAFEGNRTELITTMGAKGARLQQGHLDIFVSVDAIRVEDSIGAGDAFAAAYIIARHAGLPPDGRLEVANAAGAIAASFAGARLSANELANFWEGPRPVPTLATVVGDGRGIPPQEKERSMPLTASADGWRGKIGQGFTPQAAARLADAALHVLRGTFGARVLVSHDGRTGSDEAADLILKVAQRRGCDEVSLARLLPTPIATSLLAEGAIDVAFVITASHNPSDWNGLKIKAGRLGSVSGQLERQIDEQFRASTEAPPIAGDDDATDHRTLDATALVEQHCERLSQRLGALSWSKMRIVVDGLGGVAGQPVAQLCRRLGAEVNSVGDLVLRTFGGVKPDPILPNSQERCRRAVLADAADLGIILDGDGDRIVLVGHNGDVWQAQELLAALLHNLPETARKQTDGPILVTSATGSLIRRFATRQGRELIETGIGFKHIASEMNARKHSVGIGAVGDFGFQAYGADRDPFAMILLLAAAFPRLREIPAAIERLRDAYGTAHLQWVEHHWRPSGTYDLTHAHAVLLSRVAAVGGVPMPCVDGCKFQLAHDQWLMTRPSTTEGGIRLYGEVSDPTVAANLLAMAQQDLEQPISAPTSNSRAPATP